VFALFAISSWKTVKTGGKATSLPRTKRKEVTDVIVAADYGREARAAAVHET
jgi:hypothetical protein